MENEEFVKKLYLSSVESPNRRVRPLGRWEYRVKEYINEKGERGEMSYLRSACGVSRMDGMSNESVYV